MVFQTSNTNSDLGFANGLAIIPPSLVDLKLHYPGVVPRNHDFSPPRIPKTAGCDLLSSKLSELSQQLTKLDLSGVLDYKDLFNTTTTWPHLQSLEVGFDGCTPSGDWLVEEDPVEPEYPDAEPYDDAVEYHIEPEYIEDEVPARTGLSLIHI